MGHYFELTHFDDFLAVAREQGPGEHLLIAVARRELPEDHTPEQARQFADGEGGHLAPIAIVDRPAHHIDNFANLVKDADASVPQSTGWDAMFVAAMPGEGSKAPAPEEIYQAGESMLAAIREGRISAYLLFDRSGYPLQVLGT